MQSGVPAEQKVAIITGASSGIGRETAVALSANNWRLVLTARSQAGLEETARLCSGPVPCLVSGDINDELHVVFAFEAAKREYGRLDLLFNNAGINAPGVPMEELPLSKFQDVMNTNVVAAFLCTREAFKMFKSQNPQGGRIINNGSISSHTPRPHSVAYTASKHAITGLTKSTALDGRAFNIACTQINIGNARTDMAARLEQGALQPNGEIKPEPMMNVKHVADTIVHIASLPNTVSVLEMDIMYVPSILAFGMILNWYDAPVLKHLGRLECHSSEEADKSACKQVSRCIFMDLELYTYQSRVYLKMCTFKENS